MVQKTLLPVPEQKVLETAKTTLAIAKEKPKLSKYGFGADYFTAFETDINDAALYKSDEEISREIVAGTALKNEKLAEAVKWCEGIKLRLELAVPEARIEFPANFKKARKDEKTMLEVLPNICSLTDKYEVKLKERGLTDEEKAQGVLLRNELDALNKTQESLKKRRPEYTAERIAAYMKLYNAVNEINKAGRLAYADSEAELLLFKTPWSGGEKKRKTSDENKTPVQ